MPNIISKGLGKGSRKLQFRLPVEGYPQDDNEVYKIVIVDKKFPAQ